MSITLQKYLAEVRAALICASCLHNFPCQVLERHNKPEVEIQTSPELILDPVTVERGNGECCLIEQTINSTRVSFKFLKPADEMEDYLLHTYLRFMMHRAEQFELVRRIPLPGYQLSFLVTNYHLERYSRDKLVDFIVKIVEGLGKQLSDSRLYLNTRNRAIVEHVWATIEASLPTATAT